MICKITKEKIVYLDCKECDKRHICKIESQRLQQQKKMKTK